MIYAGKGHFNVFEISQRFWILENNWFFDFSYVSLSLEQTETRNWLEILNLVNIIYPWQYISSPSKFWNKLAQLFLLEKVNTHNSCILPCTTFFSSFFAQKLSFHSWCNAFPRPFFHQFHRKLSSSCFCHNLLVPLVAFPLFLEIMIFLITQPSVGVLVIDPGSFRS